MAKKSGVAIDFGTTNSCIAIALHTGQDTMPILIDGNNYAPTNLTFVDEGPPIACFDTSSLVYTPGNSLHNIKRIIGKRLDDPDIQRRKDNWDFTLVKDERGMAAFQVNDNGKKVIVKPEEAASKIFTKLLQVFNSTQLPEDRTNKVVLTIPVAFNVEQCERIKTAAKVAGLDIIATIYEPTAAAISSGMMTDKDKKLMIFDFGGGTLDVTIMQIKKKDQNESFFETIAESGDPDLGGELIDEILMKHYEKVLKDNGVDIRSGGEAVVKKNISLLKKSCRKLKENLSFITTDHLNWPGYTIDEKKTKIRRSKLEEMLDDNGISERIKKTVQNCLTLAKYKAENIDHVICVGGSSAIPYVREILGEIFDDRRILYSLNPEEAIAKGAAIYSRAILNGGVRDIDGTSDPKPASSSSASKPPAPSAHPDVPTIEIATTCALNYSLGYIDAYGDFDEIFEKGAKIPAKRTVNAQSANQYQPNMITKVCYRNDDNSPPIQLTQYTVDFEGRRGDKVTETWSLDAGGNLTIQSVLIVSGTSVSNKVSVSNLYFTTQEINQMTENASRYRESLEANGRIDQLEKTLDTEIIAARKMCKGKPSVLRDLNKEIDPIVDWIDEGRKGRTEQDYDKQLKKLRQIVQRFRSSLY